MNQRRQEIMLGIFVLTGLVILGVLIIFFRDVVSVGQSYYQVTAIFKNVYGMRPGTPVRLIGIDVGRIEDLSLTPDGMQAQVILRIEARRRIRNDATLRIRPQGILGDYYLEFGSGSEDAGLLPTDGSAVVEGESTSILEMVSPEILKEARNIGQKVSTLADDMQDIIGDEQFRQDVKVTVSNLRGATADAPAAIKSVHDAARNFALLAAVTRQTLQSRESDLKAAVADFRKTIELANDVLGAVDNVMQTVERGEGTIGALLEKNELYQKLVKTVDETNQTLVSLQDLVKLIREKPSIFFWGK